MSINIRVRYRPDRDHLQLAYTDPLTGKTKTKSAGTSKPKEAERAAANWEAELSQRHGLTAVRWELFRVRFEDEHLSTLAKASQANYMHGMNKFEKLIGKPRDLADINASIISQYAAKLRADLASSASVASNLMILRSVLGWAALIGLIQAAPKIRIPEIHSRGRSITLLEFVALLRRIKQQQPEHHKSLHRLCYVMWLGGLRLSEAIKLHVDKGPVQVDLASRRPAIAWSRGGQKSKKVERSPIAIDFARYLTRFESGPVVGCPLAQRTISKVISAAGHGITSHDLRRTFGTRWALRVHPLVLKAMMRHKSLETTLKYYVDLDVDNVADQLWTGVHESVHVARVPPTNFANQQSKNP